MFKAFWKENANKAIDGNTARVFSDRSCVATYKETNPWWRVDFTKLIEVYAIVITPGKFLILE